MLGPARVGIVEGEHPSGELSAGDPRYHSAVRDLALAFLRLGFTAFGGPAVHIAMMEEEFVRRRQWLTREQFLDLVGAAGLLPGPSSTEVAIYIGYRRAGARGLLAAGLCFILPAAVLVTVIAWAYVRFGRLPSAGGALYGIKAVIIAVVVQALIAFGRTALKTWGLALLGAAAVIANAANASPLAVLVVAGIVNAGVRWRAGRAPGPGALVWGLPGAAIGASAAGAVTLPKVFAVFLKIGAVVFGSGYVLLAFLRSDLVEQTHWLTEGQLIDAVAVGQFTPGPVFTTATFVGYLLAGVPGAAVATAGIFLPSFVLVAASGPLVARVRRSVPLSAFLDGVNVASVAIMAVVTARLARAAIVDIPTAALAIASAIVLIRWRLNSVWLILVGGVAGAALRWNR
jgi:chromate transporter